MTVAATSLSAEAERQRQQWCLFYDNDRGNVETALKELNRAFANGLISEADYVEIDGELRKHQASIEPKPKLRQIIGGALIRKLKPRRYQCAPDSAESRRQHQGVAGS